jgi:flagellar basal body-associated protein FliL
MQNEQRQHSKKSQGKTMKVILTTVAVIALLSGCASTISPKAAKIQVHTQMSTLLSNCKNLGPVTATSRAFGYEEAWATAKNQVREAAADKDGDTLVILNTDRDGLNLTIQGTALRCY